MSVPSAEQFSDAPFEDQFLGSSLEVLSPHIPAVFDRWPRTSPMYARDDKQGRFKDQEHSPFSGRVPTSEFSAPHAARGNDFMTRDMTSAESSFEEDLRMPVHESAPVTPRGVREGSRRRRARHPVIPSRIAEAAHLDAVREADRFLEKHAGRYKSGNGVNAIRSRKTREEYAKFLNRSVTAKRTRIQQLERQLLLCRRERLLIPQGTPEAAVSLVGCTRPPDSSLSENPRMDLSHTGIFPLPIDGYSSIPLAPGQREPIAGISSARGESSPHSKRPAEDEYASKAAEHPAVGGTGLDGTFPRPSFLIPPKEHLSTLTSNL